MGAAQLQQTAAGQQVHMNLVIAMCGIAKVFVGELVETGAPDIGPSHAQTLQSQNDNVCHVIQPHKMCSWPFRVSRPRILCATVSDLGSYPAHSRQVLVEQRHG
jgi:hypothetical protein